MISKEVLLNNVNSYCGKAHKLYVTLNTFYGLYLITIPKLTGLSIIAGKRIG